MARGATTRFEPNMDGIKKVATSETVQSWMNKLAERVAAQVRRDAPVMGVPEYRNTIVTTPAEVEGDKVRATVGSTDAFWHLVEFGSINNPAHHPLERGVTAVGIQFKPEGR